LTFKVGQAVCTNGHPDTPENRYSSGNRCKICGRESYNSYHQDQRAIKAKIKMNYSEIVEVEQLLALAVANLWTAVQREGNARREYLAKGEHTLKKAIAIMQRPPSTRKRRAVNGSGERQ
jgi:hypothetical protein